MFVEPLTEERAARTLYRIELLRKIREQVGKASSFILVQTQKLPSKIASSTTKRLCRLEFMSGHKRTVFIASDFLCVASVNQCKDFLLSLFVAP